MTTSLWTDAPSLSEALPQLPPRPIFIAYIAHDGMAGTPIHLLAGPPRPPRTELLRAQAHAYPEALAIDLKTYEFRLPDSTIWQDMGRRRKLQGMIRALIRQRLENPGAPISADELTECVWPGEKILRSAAQNRLYVTMTMLRRCGFAQWIENTHGGYMLKKNLEVVALTA